jgi:hypothetical protein
METWYYEVVRIDGDYAHLRSTNRLLQGSEDKDVDENGG